MTAPARAAAHAVLRKVHTGQADLPQAQAHAREGLADPRDRRLAAEIATGTRAHRVARLPPTPRSKTELRQIDPSRIFP